MSLIFCATLSETIGLVVAVSSSKFSTMLMLSSHLNLGAKNQCTNKDIKTTETNRIEMSK